MIPTLSCLSVSYRPADRLHHRCSWRYLCISPLHRQFRRPLLNSRSAVSRAFQPLSGCLSPQTYSPACAPFTPNKSGQRLHPPYYRGCWHGVSRCLFDRYRLCQVETQPFFPVKSCLQFIEPSSSTRRGCVSLSAIAQDSSLLPPVGVGAVSQSPCG